MAVSFKVPASPKRNIASTDTFMGVDMTNTGVNVEGYRSPNAPNMVRHVPGKVRKRMGYYKEILFGRDIDVNYAWGASAKYKEVFVDPDHTNTWLKVYDLIQELKSKDEQAFSLYVEFDYQSAEDFYVINDSTSVTASGEEVDPRNNELYEHFSGTVEFASTDTLSEIQFKSVTDQPIYIKEFAIVREKSDHYKWSPAPKYFVERSSDDPVYGCHFLRNGKDSFDGDRVVNTNRVLNTHDTFDEFTATTSASYNAAYRLAEIPGAGTTTYIDFDYEYVGSSQSSLRFGNDESRSVTLSPTAQTQHISAVFNGHSWRTDRVDLLTSESGSFSIKIKNLSLVYEKDENYAWSPAPEDVGKKFHNTDMYSYETKNYAAIEDFNRETTGTDMSHTATIATENSHVNGLTRVAFDLTTSHDDELTFYMISLHIRGTYGSSEVDYTSQQWFHSGTDDVDFHKKHFEFFLNASNGYIKEIRVVYNCGASCKVRTQIENITLQECSLKDDFSVNPKWFLYHVGKEFFLRANDSDNFVSAYDDANEHLSKSWQINNSSYIIDGKNIYEFSIEEGVRVKPIDQDNAYIPTVTIAKEPSGGGQSYEAFNLLQPGFYETFIGQAGVTEYQLTFGNLDDTECKAWVLDSNGAWNIKVENTDFTVNRGSGKVTFTTAPGATPITGEPSVKILAYRTIEDYRDRITKCTFGTLFGIGGAGDRIFLSGNPDHPNWDFYSQRNDATYFPDIGYATLGSEQSRINGYAIVSNYLATFKDGFDPAQSVFIREGDLLEVEEGAPEEPVFRLINTLQGEGSVAPYSFGYLQTEPLFLTKAGIYAITEQDITGEKYSQNRSFYLDGKLRKEQNLETAIATIYDDQYVLALNGQLFILDGLQATRTDKSEPYATRQYAGFYCDDIPATCLWTDDQICFGTHDGRVCRFYSDEAALESYNDDGKPIYACWETPDLDGQMFYKNKTFRYFAVRLMSAIKTSAKLYSRKLGVWTEIREETVIQNPIDFENLDFDMFTFSVDTSEKVIHTKLRVKKVDKARFRIENNQLNEPFGISDIALEYIESGNYKG